MSMGYMDDLDTEYDDSYDDAELYDEGIYDDESAASRARKRRAQALAAARRRAATRRTSRSLPTTAPPRAVVSAVKELDLQTKVQEDATRSAIATQNKKLDRSNLATVATLVIGEGLRTFGEPENSFVRAGIQASPLLLLAPGRSRPGLEGYLRHPAFAGGVGVLGLAFIAEQRKRNEVVQTVDVIGPQQLGTNQEDVFLADVFDARGKQSSVVVTWESDNPAVVTVDPNTGRVKAGGSAGVAIITARAGNVVRRTRTQVVASATTK
jgi:hypothetical protein